MKIKTIWATTIIAMGLAACETDGPNTPTVTDVAGSYAGYSLTSFAYASNILSQNDSVRVVANADGTATVTLTSQTWGTMTIPNAQLTLAANGTRILKGNGTAVMAGHGGGTANEYQATLDTTSISSLTDAQFRFTVPAVMGGTRISFTTGQPSAKRIVAGTYSGHTAASFWSRSMYANAQRANVTVGDGDTLTVTLVSKQWGTFTARDATVTEANGTYTITGEGQVAMSMHSGGATNTYAFTLTATTNAAKSDYTFTWSIPEVMGGVSLVLRPGAAPATESTGETTSTE